MARREYNSSGQLLTNFSTKAHYACRITHSSLAPGFDGYRDERAATDDKSVRF
jgi:hypothetical protein